MNDRKLGKDISVVYRCSQVFFDAQLKQYGLGSGQYIYLVNLYGNNGVTQQELSDIINMDKTTTARTIDKLVKAGYVRKQPSDTDKRAYLLYTTDRAEAIKHTLLELMAEWNQLLFTGFDEAERATVVALMDRVSVNALAVVKGS